MSCDTIIRLIYATHSCKIDFDKAGETWKDVEPAKHVEPRR